MKKYRWFISELGLIYRFPFHLFFLTLNDSIKQYLVYNIYLLVFCNISKFHFMIISFQYCFFETISIYSNWLALFLLINYLLFLDVHIKLGIFKLLVHWSTNYLMVNIYILLNFNLILNVCKFLNVYLRFFYVF